MGGTNTVGASGGSRTSEETPDWGGGVERVGGWGGCIVVTVKTDSEIAEGVVEETSLQIGCRMRERCQG